MSESVGVVVPITTPTYPPMPETTPQLPLPQYPAGSVFPGNDGKL